MDWEVCVLNVCGREWILDGWGALRAMWEAWTFGG